MALYQAASSWARASETCKIPRTEAGDGFTLYIIEVHIPPFTWFVKHRYSEFFELHEKLTANYHVDKNLLPPKKLFGSQSETFILKRQGDLQLYLQTLIHRFGVLPGPLATFLDFHKYEVRTIAGDLSESLYYQGDQILSANESFKFTPLQLHCVAERLKLAEPTCVSGDKKQDLGHLLDFVTRLKHLKIVGSYEHVGNSNIIPNNLTFDLSPFKSLDVLDVQCCELQDRLQAAEPLHETLKTLIVHKSFREISSILLCGVLHWSPIDPIKQWPCWRHVTHANFSHNFLTRLHPSIRLLSSVENLDVSYNNIQDVENLDSLPHLAVLNISHNKIRHLDALHTRLGNIRCLNLGGNSIENLQGLSRLFSLVELHLNDNHILALGEVGYLGKLPCLEKLNLANNPINTTVDYRAHVLLTFESRASEMILDGQKASEKEVDTVAVLQALQVARGDHHMCQHPEKICFSDKREVSHSNHSGSVCNLDTSVKVSRTSHFRQQVETLRRLGGNDWLRLLNQMQETELSKDLLEGADIEKRSNENPVKKTLLDAPFGNEECHNLTSDDVHQFAISMEVSFPEWIFSLDCKNQAFLQYSQNLIQERNLLTGQHGKNMTDNEQETNVNVSNLKEIVWATLVMQQNGSISQIPLCLNLLSTEIVLFKMENMDITSPNSVNFTVSKIPNLCYFQTLMPSNILTTYIGPRRAYAEIQISSLGGIKNLLFFLPNCAIADRFFECMKNLYSLVITEKRSPFINETLILEEFHCNSELAEMCVQRQILFCRRVMPSRIVPCVRPGKVHYIAVTPSHVILIEENLTFPHVLNLESIIHPPFHACVIISIRSNIHNIHLKDENGTFEDKGNFVEAEKEESENDMVQKGNHLKTPQPEQLCTCGAWLFMEFETATTLYVRFLTVRDRSEFLEAFLCVRSQ